MLHRNLTLTLRKRGVRTSGAEVSRRTEGNWVTDENVQVSNVGGTRRTVERYCSICHVIESTTPQPWPVARSCGPLVNARPDTPCSSSFQSDSSTYNMLELTCKDHLTQTSEECVNGHFHKTVQTNRSTHGKSERRRWNLGWPVVDKTKGWDASMELEPTVGVQLVRPVEQQTETETRTCERTGNRDRCRGIGTAPSRELFTRFRQPETQRLENGRRNAQLLDSSRQMRCHLSKLLCSSTSGRALGEVTRTENARRDTSQWDLRWKSNGSVGNGCLVVVEGSTRRWPWRHHNNL